MAFEIRQDYFSIETLNEFLVEIEGDFARSLSSRVGDLGEYAKKLFDHGTILAAVEDDRLAGMAAVYMNDTESCCAFLAQIVVCKAFRRRNIARQLLEEAFNLAKLKGMQFMRLEVDMSATPAVSLYQKLGFRRERILSRDAMLMVRPLGQERAFSDGSPASSAISIS